VEAATVLAERLGREARSLELYVARVERLLRTGRVPQIDLDRAYVAGYVLFHASVERTIEQLFVGLLTGELTVTQPGVTPVVVFSDQSTAFRIVLGERKYVDWLPFGRYTKPRAQAFLTDGKPFTSLQTADSQFLERMSLLRNALAHRSAHSLKQFDQAFIQSPPVPVALPPSQRKPIGYLRGQHAVNQSRLSYQLAEGVAIVRRLCA
jgi:hypothetical protein